MSMEVGGTPSHSGGLHIVNERIDTNNMVTIHTDGETERALGILQYDGGRTAKSTGDDSEFVR